MESTISGLFSSSSILIENNKLWVEVLKILLSWPPIILILGILYKNEVKGFIASVINRIISVHLPGFQVDLNPSNQTQLATDDEDNIKKLRKEVEETKNKEFIEHIKTQILPVVNKLSEDLDFERIWNLIFRGQLNIMQLIYLQPK